MPFKTNLLPLLPPQTATAAKVNTMIPPYCCQTGICRKVMKGQKWEQSKVFGNMFKDLQVLWRFWKGMNLHNCSLRKQKMQISHNEVRLAFFFPQLNKVWRRTHCLSVSCEDLLSDRWHFVSRRGVPSASVPHVICVYRVCLRDKTTQGTSLGGNWDCRHLASLMSAIQH